MDSPGSRDAPEIALARLLALDPADVGCRGACSQLELYVETELAGTDPHERFPGAATHFRLCPACRADRDGLRAALSADLWRSSGKSVR